MMRALLGLTILANAVCYLAWDDLCQAAVWGLR